MVCDSCRNLHKKDTEIEYCDCPCHIEEENTAEQSGTAPDLSLYPSTEVMEETIEEYKKNIAPSEKNRCSICGRDTSPGSGNFVNRVPDLNTVEERRDDLNRKYPEGEYICPICDSEHEEDPTSTNDGCDSRLSDGSCEPCALPCPTPDLKIEHGLLCKWAEDQLS